MNTIEKQIELLRICNEKEMRFESSPKHGLINVFKFDSNSEPVFYEFIFIDNKNAIKNLNGLIKKVKKFK